MEIVNAVNDDLKTGLSHCETEARRKMEFILQVFNQLSNEQLTEQLYQSLKKQYEQPWRIPQKASPHKGSFSHKSSFRHHHPHHPHPNHNYTHHRQSMTMQQIKMAELDEEVYQLYTKYRQKIQLRKEQQLQSQSMVAEDSTTSQEKEKGMTTMFDSTTSSATNNNSPGKTKSFAMKLNTNSGQYESKASPTNHRRQTVSPSMRIRTRHQSRKQSVEENDHEYKPLGEEEEEEDILAVIRKYFQELQERSYTSALTPQQFQHRKQQQQSYSLCTHHLSKPPSTIAEIMKHKLQELIILADEYNAEIKPVHMQLRNDHPTEEEYQQEEEFDIDHLQVDESMEIRQELDALFAVKSLQFHTANSVKEAMLLVSVFS
jgi:hypothetical protein